MSSALAQRNGSAAPTIPFEDVRESPAALESYTRAEIDVQIATAHRFPRSPHKALQEALGVATMTPEIARRCNYAKPKAGGFLEGPSVRLAEIVASCWGNLRTTSRITNDDGRMITAQVVCIDLEKNNGVSIEVLRPVIDRNGRRYSDDMIATTAMAAVSIAFRNGVFRVVPRVIVDEVAAQALRVARGDAACLDDRRVEAVGYFQKLGVPDDRIYAAIGASGWADVTLDRLTLLQGLQTAHEEGEALAVLFPDPAPPEPPKGPGGRSQGLLDEIKGRRKPDGYEPGATG